MAQSLEKMVARFKAYMNSLLHQLPTVCYKLCLVRKISGKDEQEKTDKCMISSDFYCIKIEKSMLTCKPENDDALAKPPGTQRDKW